MQIESGNENPNALLERAVYLMNEFWVSKTRSSLGEEIENIWNLERDYLKYLALSLESYPPGLNAEQKAQFDLQNMGIVKKLKLTRDELQRAYRDMYKTIDRRDFGKHVMDPSNPNSAQATRELIKDYFASTHLPGEAADLDDMISFLWKLETGGQGTAEEVLVLKTAYQRFYKKADRLAIEYTNAGLVAEDEKGANGPIAKKPVKLELSTGDSVDTEAYQQLYRRNLNYFQKQNPNDFLLTELRIINYEREKAAAKLAKWDAIRPEMSFDPHEGETEKQRAKREKEELRKGIKEAGGTIKMVGLGLRKVFNVVGQTNESLALIDKIKECLYFLDSLELTGEQTSAVRRILMDGLDKLEVSGPAADGYGSMKKVCEKSAQKIVSDLMQQEPLPIKKAFNAAVKANSVTETPEAAETAETVEAVEGSMPDISVVPEQRDEAKRGKEKQKAKSDAVLEIDSKIENLEVLIAGGRVISSIVESIYETAIKGGMTYDEFNSLMSRECIYTKGFNRREDLVNAGAVIDEDAIMKKVENRLRGKPEFRANLATFMEGRKRASSAVERRDTVPVAPSEPQIDPNEIPAVLDMENPGLGALQEREDIREDFKEKGEAISGPASVPLSTGKGEGSEEDNESEMTFLERSITRESQEAVSLDSGFTVAQPQPVKYLQKEVDQQLKSIYEKMGYLNSNAVRNEHEPILSDIRRELTKARAMGNSKQSRDAITHELGRLQHQDNILTFKVSSKLASRSRWERFLDSGIGRFLQSIFAPFRPARPAIPTLYPAIKPVSVAIASATAPVAAEEPVGMLEEIPPLVSDRDSSVERRERTVSAVASEPEGRPYTVEMARDGQDKNRTKILQKITKVLELLRVSDQYSEEEKYEIRDALMRDLQRYDEVFSENGKVEAFDESFAQLSKFISRFSESSEEVLLKAGLKVKITNVRMLDEFQDLDQDIRELIGSVLKADFERVNTHPSELTARYQGVPTEILRRMVAEIMLPDFIVLIQNEMIELYHELSEAFKALNPADQVAYQNLKDRVEFYEKFIDSITQPGALEHLENKNTEERIEILQNLEGALNELKSVKGALIESLNRGIFVVLDAFYDQYQKIADTQSQIEDASLVSRDFIHPNDHTSIQHETDSAFDFVTDMMRKFFGNDSALLSATMSSSLHHDFDRLVRVFDRLNNVLEQKILSVQKRIIDLHRQLSDDLEKVKGVLGSEYTLVNYDALMAKKESLSELVGKIEALGSPENIRGLTEDQKVEMLKYLKDQVEELDAALKELHQANVEPVQLAEEVSTQPRTSWTAPLPKERSSYQVSVSLILNGNSQENREFASQLGGELVAISSDKSLRMSAAILEVKDFSVDFEVVCDDLSQLESIAAKLSEIIRTSDKSHVVFAADSSDASDPQENSFQREFDTSINNDKGFTRGE